MTAYTVEVAHEVKQFCGAGWTWIEMSNETVRDTESFDAAHIAYNAAIDHETRYNDSLRDGERVVVLFVEWDEDAWGNVVDSEMIYPRENDAEGWF